MMVGFLLCACGSSHVKAEYFTPMDNEVVYNTRPNMVTTMDSIQGHIDSWAMTFSNQWT